MSALTLAQQQARLAQYIEAERLILLGQEFTVGDGQTNRRLRRADLAEVRAEIKLLQSQIEVAQQQAAGTRRVLYIR